MAVTIANLEAETIRKLENDTSANADVDRWLRDSLIEIAGNPDYRDSFPELEEFGPTFNLIGGPIGTSIQEYAETNFIPIGDFLIKTLDFLLWIDFPTNTRSIQLIHTDFQDTDKFQSFPSQPTMFYRFGLSIGFEPPPDKNYQVQARIMRRHPITDYFNASGLLNTTVLLLPNEWFEILEWCAAMRGYMEKLNYERAAQIRTMIWGDPSKPNDNPGLIASIKTKKRAEAWLQTGSLRPVIKQSCWGQ